MKVIAAIACLMGFSIGFSQEYNEKIGQLIEGNIQSCVYVEIGNNFGSGILVVDDRSIYLITALHVIFRVDNHGSQTLKGVDGIIKFYTQNFVVEKENIINFDLKTLLESGKIKIHPQMDVCVIKLAEHKDLAINYIDGVTRSEGGVTYNPFPLNEVNRIKDKDDLYLGDDLFIVGFPNTIGLSRHPQFDTSRPLFKKCSVASLSDRFATFVTDCLVYGGNSGGAVFLERRGPNVVAVYLVGIIVERIPSFMNLLDEQETPLKGRIVDQTSSYSIVVPIKYAIELIEKF